MSHISTEYRVGLTNVLILRNFTFKKLPTKTSSRSGMDSGVDLDERRRKRLSDVIQATADSLCGPGSSSSGSALDNTPSVHSGVVRRRLDLS